MYKMIKKARHHYASPTPVKWRKLGDALLSVSAAVTGYAIVGEEKNIAIAALICGVVGKFLTNFFKED